MRNTRRTRSSAIARARAEGARTHLVAIGDRSVRALSRHRRRRVHDARRASGGDAARRSVDRARNVRPSSPPEGGARREVVKLRLVVLVRTGAHDSKIRGFLVFTERARLGGRETRRPAATSAPSLPRVRPRDIATRPVRHRASFFSARHGNFTPFPYLSTPRRRKSCISSCDGHFAPPLCAHTHCSRSISTYSLSSSFCGK